MTWLYFFIGTTTGMFVCICVFLWIARSNRNSIVDVQDREIEFRRDLMAAWEERNRVSRMEAGALIDIATSLRSRPDIDDDGEVP